MELSNSLNINQNLRKLHLLNSWFSATIMLGTIIYIVISFLSYKNSNFDFRKLTSNSQPYRNLQQEMSNDIFEIAKQSGIYNKIDGSKITKSSYSGDWASEGPVFEEFMNKKGKVYVSFKQYSTTYRGAASLDLTSTFEFFDGRYIDRRYIINVKIHDNNYTINVLNLNELGQIDYRTKYFNSTYSGINLVSTISYKSNLDVTQFNRAGPSNLTMKLEFNSKDEIESIDGMLTLKSKDEEDKTNHPTPISFHVKIEEENVSHS